MVESSALYEETDESLSLHRALYPHVSRDIVVKVAQITTGLDAASVLMRHRERFPLEAEMVSRAVPKRVFECLAARNLARAALLELGAPIVSIGCGSRREPLWPKGVVGTIAHSNRFVMVAIAPSERFRAVGIDVEPNQPLPTDVHSHVCLPGEADGAPASRAVFVVKEAFYKAHFGVHRRFLDFPSVRVTWGKAQPNHPTSAQVFNKPHRNPVPGTPETIGSTRLAVTQWWAASELAPPVDSIGPTTLHGLIAVTPQWLSAFCAIEA
jgi:4'-phosphopantetheinyl transferase EntD